MFQQILELTADEDAHHPDLIFATSTVLKLFRHTTRFCTSYKSFKSLYQILLKHNAISKQEHFCCLASITPAALNINLIYNKKQNLEISKSLMT